MDITKMSVKDLKALAYDLIVKQQQIQNDLTVITNQIAKLLSAVPQEGEVADDSEAF
jgi:transcriptional antiterminator